MAELQYAVEDGIGTIRLNRPERKNALTFEMVDALYEVLVGARTDDEVRGLMLCGAGGTFCSGLDLSLLPTEQGRLSGAPLEFKQMLTDRIQRIALAVEDLDKPLVAAIAGSAVGAGLDFALMCDMRIAAASAKLAESYVRVGLVPGAGGCYFLPRLVGRAKALELLLTGDFVGAAEAEKIGLVNRVVPDEEVESSALELIRGIAARPPVTVAMIKRATYQSEKSDLRTALDLISSHMAVVTSTEDSREAMAALAERREPRFRGR